MFLSLGLEWWGDVGRKELSLLGLLLSCHTKTRREELEEGKQGRHRSPLGETELQLQPNQSDQLGQSLLVLAASAT